MNARFAFWAAALLLLAALPASAQSRSERRLDIGAKAGTTLSRIQFNPNVPQTMLPGITAGITVRYAEEKHFGLIAELSLTQRGWKETFDAEYDMRYQRRLTYLELPLLTHICFGSQRVKGFFNAGPQVGFLLSSAIKSNFDYEQAASDPDFPIENRSTAQFALPVKNRFDYGICAGLGMEVRLQGRSNIALEGRFYYGMRDLFANHRSDPFAGSSAMTVAVTLAYNYRLR